MKQHLISSLMLWSFLFISGNAKPQNWLPVGGGVDGEIKKFYVDSVSDLLYLAGSFEMVDGMHIKGVTAYNGQNFDSLNYGPDANTFGLNPVYGITKYAGEIIIGGAFSDIDHLPELARIGRWNGIQWDSLPGNIYFSANYHPSIPRCFFVNDTSVFIGGHFTHPNPRVVDLLNWNGTQWTSYDIGGDSIGTGINSVLAYDGKLFYGGNFLGVTNSINNIGYLDSTGFHDAGVSDPDASISSMAVFRNELYVAGRFFQSNGNAGNFIMRWDGSTWQDVGDGVNNDVACLAVYNDNLYAGGAFSIAGGNIARGIAKWDGISWYPLGNDTIPIVLAMAFYKNELYISTSTQIGNLTVNHLAKYTGPLSISDFAKQSLNFYISPNHSQNSIIINFTSPLIKNVILSATDPTGKEQFRLSIPSQTLRKELDISELTYGIYFITLESESGRVSKKFIKE